MNLERFFEQEAHEVALNTPIGEITVSRERNLYIALVKLFKSYEKKAATEFVKRYDTYKSCQDILDNAVNDFQASISFILDEFKAAMIAEGNYDLTYQEIYDCAVDNNMLAWFDDIYDKLEDEVYKILSDLDDAREYRQARKDSRGRWVGGTIGGDAFAAINQQGRIAAMNAASGAAHSVVNAVGNYASEMAAKSELDDLFNNGGYRRKFEVAVERTVSNLKWLYSKVDGLKDEFDWVTSDEETKAFKMASNLIDGLIPADKQEEVLREIFELDPYSRLLHYYLFSTFGDDGTLSELAEYFGTTDILNDQKANIAYVYYRSIVGETEDGELKEFETEENALKVRALLEEYCQKNRIDTSESSDIFEEVDKALADFDLKYRTVDGIEHETREAADFSREEFPKIQSFMENVKPLNSEPLLTYENDLLAKKAQFENSFSSELSKKYLKVIENYLDKFEKAFLDVGFLGASNREEAAKKRALKYAKGLKYTTLDEFNQQYNTFCYFIKVNLGISIDEATEAREFLNKKRSRLEGGGGLKGLFGRR